MIIDLVLYYLSGKGGVEQVITELGKAFKKKGHTLRIIMAYPPSYRKWLNTLDNVYYYGLGATVNSESYLEFAKNYKKLLTLIGMPDICLATHIPLQSYICYYALEENNKLSIPLMSFLHGSIQGSYSRESIGFCSSHLAVSNTIKNDIKNLVGNKRVYLVGNPVNSDNIFPVKRPKDKLKILHLCRLENEKNTTYLLNSLSKLNGNWSLDIIGDGTLLNILKQQSIDLNIFDKINWLGWQDDPWSQVVECSLLISTATIESFSLSLVEGLARGIPVISTKLNGPKDFIVEGKNGWFIDINNEYSLVTLLNNIIHKKILLPNEEYCIQSVSNFNSNIVVDKIETALLKEINLFKGSKD